MSTENALQIFENKEFGTIRTVDEGGTILFCASDIAKALGYSNPRDAIIRHCRGVVKRDGVSLTTNQHGTTTEQTSEMSFIPEGDIYRLIAHSKLPSSEKFEKWLFDDVLPTIRKTGAYMTPQTVEQILSDPDTIIRLATQIKELHQKNALMQPKADYFDALVDRNLLTNFRDTAKELKAKQSEFIKFLLDNGYVYRDESGKLLPYSLYCEQGLFELKECFNEKSDWSGTQTLITPKGRETFRLLIA
jgi:prophage antirepressor-like protein